MATQNLQEAVKALWEDTGANEFFAEPLTGVADAADPLFAKLKAQIGDYYWTPAEAFAAAGLQGAPRSVIAWVLPQRPEVRAANRAEKERPAKAWARVRSFGELANEEMRRQMALWAQAQGAQALAPHLLQVAQGWKMQELGWSSHWSERHTAFVAGLGTFGLSAGLITEAGIAVRIGSVVTSLPLAPTPRPYGDDPLGWCLRCGACARRCPAHAIGATLEARDKNACANYIMTKVEPLRASVYGWGQRALGCGLCQTGVPCEFARPGA